MTNAKHDRPLVMGKGRLVLPSMGTVREQSNVNDESRHLVDAAGLAWTTAYTCRSATVNLLDSVNCTQREIAARLGKSVEALMGHYFDAESAAVSMADVLETALNGTDPAGNVDIEMDTKGAEPVLSRVKAG